MRYAAKRDANEPEIVEALREDGCLVRRCDWVDLVVQRKGQTFLIEIKTIDGDLTELQKRLLADGWDIRVVRSVDEAKEAVK